jgi:MYXO-CTERM domain-containing protein
MKRCFFLLPTLCCALRSHILPAMAVMLAANATAVAATFTFDTDPLAGTTIRSTPGRQVVGGELFLSFFAATDVFAFNPLIFGGGNQIHFANGLINDIPATGVNVVVLQTLDNDANPGTPFGAGNAADLIASRITDHGPGVFIYFNSSLDLPRLVYSDDLASNQSDLKILARMLNLNGQTGRNALPTFSAANFAIADSQTSAAPEPSGFVFMGGGVALLGLGTVLRRRRV